MIISHEHRYVFLAVPHTASTAIGNELCENYGGESVLAKHSWLDELLRHSDRDLSGYFIFCAVRNPLDIVTTRFFRLRTDHDGRFTDGGRHVPERRIRKFEEIRGEDLTFTDYVMRYHRTTYINWMLASIGKRADAVLHFEKMETEFERVVDARVGVSNGGSLAPFRIGTAGFEPPPLCPSNHAPSTSDETLGNAEQSEPGGAMSRRPMT